VAAISPPSDRRARLALILALVGVPSIGVTLPTAIWLGLSSAREQRLASGGEPAMGFLALSLAGIDLMFIQQALVRYFEAIGPLATLSVLASGALLALAVLATTAAILRIHPERYGALLVTRAGLLASLGGGGAMFVRLLVSINS
jgi:hypothetical protein